MTRRFVQIAIGVSFVLLIVSPPDGPAGDLPRELFWRLDPLVAVTTILASRSWVPFVGAAFLTVALTIAFGRVWCGWMCPLGSLLDIVPARKTSRNASDTLLRVGKYVTLAAIIGAALFGSLSLMFLDPVTIVTRPLQELVMPYYGNDALGVSVGTSLRRDLLGGIAIISTLPLLLVLGLNALGRRTFCDTLCPLGGMLALISKLPGVRRVVSDERCTSCKRCATVCSTSAIDPEAGYVSDPARCTACMECIDACPSDANTFEPSLPGSWRRSFDPGRRDAIATLGGSTGFLALSLAVPAVVPAKETLRPPGGNEDRLARLCVRCGACFSACPTGVLVPSLSLVSEAGFWTPELTRRPNHCTLDCNLCAEVCPTGALWQPNAAEAAQMGLGAVARVDKTRCLAARGRSCLQCIGTCPIKGALATRRATDPMGYTVTIPWVDPELCVACDECARECPVQPAAIGTHL